MSDWLVDLEEAGFVMLPAMFTPGEVAGFLRDCEGMLVSPTATHSILAGGDGAAYGARNVLELWPNITALLRTASFKYHLIAAIGPECGAVRGLFFDKPPGHSWALPWHRDLTIAVQTHETVAGFSKQTLKAGVPHLEAPRSLLHTMLTARVHLDDMTLENGPLRVVPGSHRQAEATPENAVALTCRAGDVLLMRPLLLHASGHSDKATTLHRRIVHLEFASSSSLPPPLQWHDFVALA